MSKLDTALAVIVLAIVAAIAWLFVSGRWKLPSLTSILGLPEGATTPVAALAEPITGVPPAALTTAVQAVQTAIATGNTNLPPSSPAAQVLQTGLGVPTAILAPGATPLDVLGQIGTIPSLVAGIIGAAIAGPTPVSPVPTAILGVEAGANVAAIAQNWWESNIPNYGSQYTPAQQFSQELASAQLNIAQGRDYPRG